MAKDMRGVSLRATSTEKVSSITRQAPLESSFGTTGICFANFAGAASVKGLISDLSHEELSNVEEIF